MRGDPQELLTAPRLPDHPQHVAPAAERAFFGVGPVSIGVPYRYQTTDRERPLIAAEDAETANQLEALLTALSLATSRYQIEPDRTEPPAGDTIVALQRDRRRRLRDPQGGPVPGRPPGLR
ncbi:hypothetical protein [Amycolatopsis thermoflava]